MVNKTKEELYREYGRLKRSLPRTSTVSSLTEARRNRQVLKKMRSLLKEMKALGLAERPCQGSGISVDSEGKPEDTS